MNKGELRRKEILNRLNKAKAPLSASKLAKEFGVSRQIIVGDIALLRATGDKILATSRGYVMENTTTKEQVVTLACEHTFEQTEEELLIILKHGGKVRDVMVEHPLYGELKGNLYLNTPQDVTHFMKKVAKNPELLLSNLTKGLHLHTIEIPDEKSLQALKEELKAKHILYEE